MSESGTVQRDTGTQRFTRSVSSSIPAQRSAADAYRVSEEQVHRARMVVARNSSDSDDCRRLLDMLGLIAPNPEQTPPVRR